MTELQDAVTQAIQSYADDGMKSELRLAILALAPSIAAHVVSELNLGQVWGVGVFVRDGGDRWALDEIFFDDPDRSVAEQALSREQGVMGALSRVNGVPDGETVMRAALISRIEGEWVEESRPELDSRLVELASNDA